MFYKILFLCLLTVYLIQPNEAIFGLDTFIESTVNALASKANDAAKNTSYQALFTSLQAGLENATINLGLQISSDINNAILSAVNSENNFKLAMCIQKNQASITDYEISALNSIFNVCIFGNTTEGMTLISDITTLVNNITNIAMNAESTVAAVCPAPSPGDITGAVSQGFCTLNTLSSLTADFISQAVTVAALVTQATSLVANIVSSTAAALPTCVTTQLALTVVNILPLLIPIIQCTIF